MRDQLMPGKEVAVYWIEYVIRHGSTKHLQLSSKNMPFYQRHLLDVCLFLITIVLTILFLVFFIIRLIFRSCLSRKAKKDWFEFEFDVNLENNDENQNKISYVGYVISSWASLYAA